MQSDPTKTEKLAPEASPSRPPRRRVGLVFLFLACLASGALGAAGLWLALGHSGRSAAPAGGDSGKPEEAPPKQLWTCPMHPSIVQDHPGECPICGMKLVPKQQVKPPNDEDERDAHKVEGLTTVSIDPSRQQLIGLKTVPVEHGEIGATWRTVGRVAVDETRVRHINVKVSGFVERVFVDFVGKPVSKGQALFTYYSPELVAAQEEYLLAKRTSKTLGGSLSGSGDELVAAARRKLRLWDIPASDIASLERNGEVSKSMSIRSPIAGVVVRKDVVEGMQLEAGATPYEIVDLSTLWVLADVYESELSKVKVGMPATLTLQAFPLRKFEGRVSFIDPLLDPTTRTVKVRLSFANPTGDLRPEMFGEVVLKSPAREGLRIPTDAVINSGTRSVVFVALGEGKFQPREIKPGETDGQNLEVIDGLKEGEQVVTRANFLVDSESRLRASLQAMGNIAPVAVPAGAKPAAPPPASPGGGHAGHTGHAP